MILLIDRGECSFAQKVKQAENIGAVAVIISDTSNNTPSDMMEDDGTAGDLTIPSLLIKKSDAQLLKDAMAKTFISVKISFAMHNPSNKVDM